MKLSHYISFGRKGFGIERDGPAWRIRIGFMSICFGFFDIEILLGDMLGELKQTDQQQENLKRVEQTKVELNDEIKRLESRTSKLKFDNDKLCDKIQEIVKMLEKQKELCDNFESRVDNLEDELLDAESDRDNFEEERDKLEEEIVKFKFEFEVLEMYYKGDTY